MYLHCTHSSEENVTGMVGNMMRLILDFTSQKLRKKKLNREVQTYYKNVTNKKENIIFNNILAYCHIAIFIVLE